MPNRTDVLIADFQRQFPALSNAIRDLSETDRALLAAAVNAETIHECARCFSLASESALALFNELFITVSFLDNQGEG